MIGAMSHSQMGVADEVKKVSPFSMINGLTEHYERGSY